MGDGAPSVALVVLLEEHVDGAVAFEAKRIGGVRASAPGKPGDRRALGVSALEERFDGAVDEADRPVIPPEQVEGHEAGAHPTGPSLGAPAGEGPRGVPT